MITNKTSKFDPPLNHSTTDIDNNKLLLSKIEYEKTTIADSITSRNVKGYSNDVDDNTFTYILNDCNKENIFDVPLEDKYERLIKNNQTCESSKEQTVCQDPESMDDNLDNLIQTITNEISIINRKITQIRFIWKANYAYLSDKNLSISREDNEIYTEFDSILKEFIDMEGTYIF